MANLYLNLEDDSLISQLFVQRKSWLHYTHETSTCLVQMAHKNRIPDASTNISFSKLVQSHIALADVSILPHWPQHALASPASSDHENLAHHLEVLNQWQ